MDPSLKPPLVAINPPAITSRLENIQSDFQRSAHLPDDPLREDPNRCPASKAVMDRDSLQPDATHPKIVTQGVKSHRVKNNLLFSKELGGV